MRADDGEGEGIAWEAGGVGWEQEIKAYDINSALYIRRKMNVMRYFYG